MRMFYSQVIGAHLYQAKRKFMSNVQVNVQFKITKASSKLGPNKREKRSMHHISYSILINEE